MIKFAFGLIYISYLFYHSETSAVENKWHVAKPRMKLGTLIVVFIISSASETRSSKL